MKILQFTYILVLLSTSSLWGMKPEEFVAETEKATVFTKMVNQHAGKESFKKFLPTFMKRHEAVLLQLEDVQSPLVDRSLRLCVWSKSFRFFAHEVLYTYRIIEGNLTNIYLPFYERMVSAFPILQDVDLGEAAEARSPSTRFDLRAIEMYVKLAQTRQTFDPLINEIKPILQTKEQLPSKYVQQAHGAYNDMQDGYRSFLDAVDQLTPENSQIFSDHKISLSLYYIENLIRIAVFFQQPKDRKEKIDRFIVKDLAWLEKTDASEAYNNLKSAYLMPIKNIGRHVDKKERCEIRQELTDTFSKLTEWNRARHYIQLGTLVSNANDMASGKYLDKEKLRGILKQIDEMAIEINVHGNFTKESTQKFWTMLWCEKEELEKMASVQMNLPRVSLSDISILYLLDGRYDRALTYFELFLEDPKSNLGDRREACERHKCYLQFLNGDREPWLELQRKLKDIQTSKKKAQKERKHRAQVQAIQRAQAQKAQEEEKKCLMPFTPETPEPAPQLRPIVMESSIPPIDLQEEARLREERLKRHAEAELRRAKEREPTPETPAAVPAPVAPLHDPAPLPIPAPQYHLTGTAWKVHQSIEDDSWKFTLKDFEIYLRALGCRVDHKRGKGVHHGAALPTMIEVYDAQQDLMTLLPVGGMLTLPQWDQNHVPYYLRAQIQEARARLGAVGENVHK